MKKLLSILLLITSFGYSQTLLKLKAIEYAPGAGYCITTNSLGVQTYTPCSSISGLLPSTTSITINGSTQTFTSTPNFTIQPTLSDVLGYGPSTGGIPLESPNAMNSIYAFDTNAGYGYSVLESGGCDTDDSRTRLSHSLQNVLSAPTNVFDAPANNFPNATANTVSYFDASKDLKSVVLGSGLSLSSGTLTATGSGSTTTVTAGDNITVSGSAPSYTVGVSISPTFTNSTLTGTTTLTGVINHSMSASAASSATVDLSTWTGNYGHITGTVTITSFGTVQAGAKREITFDGSLTLTSNTVSLILPGNSDIQTAANDVAVFVSEGGGNWRCVSYMRNDESYTNYTPTWTGFTAAPTVAAGEARWKMLTKNTCQVIIYPSVAGTSNATTTTVTLPFAAYNAGTFGLPAYCIPILNNGAQALGSARGVSGSNVLNLYNGAIGGAWTAGGTLKAAYITIVYQIN